MTQALLVLGIVAVLAAIIGVYLVLHHRTQLRRQPAERQQQTATDLDPPARSRVSGLPRSLGPGLPSEQ